MVAKVLDFTRPEQATEIVGQPRELVVRCDGFRVTLPTTGTGGTVENPFEKVVLRLLALRRYGAAELAAETCLPVELIRFILLRLVDKGYIDDQHDLLDAGRAALGSSLRNEAADVTFSTYLVFRERISDTLLPMLVSTNDLPFRESEGRDHVKVFAGTNATVRATALGQTSGSSPVPTGRQVEEVLARMSRRARVVGSAGPGRLSGHGIVVTAEPEPYLLRCKLVIQRFDSDWRITDPSGQGYSVDLERAYRALLERDDSEAAEFNEWQRRIAAQAGPRPVPVPAARNFGDERNNRRYPELVRALRKREWYAAVEWAMFFLDQSFDLTQALQLAKVQTTAENEAAVLAAAQALGFAVDRSLLRGLVDLRTGRVTAFLRGSASMSTVLPLALLSAAQNPGHPLLTLADEMPDLVEVIAFLKSQRGDELHRRTAAPKAEDPLQSPVGLWTRQLVGALMPSFRFDGDLEETSALSGSADDRLDARLEMQSEFGRSVFVGWPTDLQDNLLDAELAWLALGDDETPDAGTFVNRLATAAQSAFRCALGRAPFGSPVDRDYVAFASERASLHGFGRLPETFKTVPDRNVEKSMHGGIGTLGSVALAYLVRADESDLIRLERHRRHLLADLDRLIALRVHANDRVDIDREDCNSLRRGIYTIIRSLLES